VIWGGTSWWSAHRLRLWQSCGAWASLPDYWPALALSWHAYSPSLTQANPQVLGRQQAGPDGSPATGRLRVGCCDEALAGSCLERSGSHTGRSRRRQIERFPAASCGHPRSGRGPSVARRRRAEGVRVPVRRDHYLPDSGSSTAPCRLSRGSRMRTGCGQRYGRPPRVGSTPGNGHGGKMGVDAETASFFHPVTGNRSRATNSPALTRSGGPTHCPGPEPGSVAE
jgi:hypothetical protein